MDTSFKGILNDCQNISLIIFKKLNKEGALQVYELLNRLKYIFSIDHSVLSSFKEILQKKMVYDNIIILNPTLKDLLNDNIFKLDVEDKNFYIPLWHHELHFSPG